MPEKINYNGNIISAEKAIFTANNRAFKYGDSLFETIRVFDGKTFFLSYHLTRLKEGMEKLGMVYPKSFFVSILQKEINKLTEKKGNHRIRLTIFRSKGGLYTPKDNSIQFLIEKTSMESSSFVLNEEGLSLGVSKHQLLSESPISHLKTGNSLPYILAGLEKEKNNYDDILIQNNKGQIAEALSSNLFVYIDNYTFIFTPPLSSGCVDGTIRKYLLTKYEGRFMEREITLKLLKAAKSVFLTNAIQGIRWVSSINEIKYSNKSLAKSYLDTLNSAKNRRI